MREIFIMFLPSLQPFQITNGMFCVTNNGISFYVIIRPMWFKLLNDGA